MSLPQAADRYGEMPADEKTEKGLTPLQRNWESIREDLDCPFILVWGGGLFRCLKRRRSLDVHFGRNQPGVAAIPEGLPAIVNVVMVWVSRGLRKEMRSFANFLR